MTKDNSGPAFPACNEANNNGTMGMTLRDYFAGQALEVAAQYNRDTWHDEATVAQNAMIAATWAYVYADAMIRARKQ